MRKKATHRGECPICGFRAALMEDGTLYRHLGGLLPPEDLLDNGICRGWGKNPRDGSETPIAGKD